MSREVSLRPALDDDQDFLFRVYAGTREEEMALAPWTDEQKAEFLQRQFTLRHTQYRQHYVDARFDIILLDGEPVGNLYVDRSESEIHVIDIALLPECRGRGIGAELLTSLLAEATEDNKPVRIYVIQGNPAIKLYSRLGFQKIGEQGIHDLMERKPA